MGFTIEDGVLKKYIGEPGVTEVVIPAGVTEIGDGAFQCEDPISTVLPFIITSVEIPYGVTEIGESAFAGCCRLTKLTIPDSVTNIGQYAFADCWRLKSLTIPDSVTNIGQSAFANCIALTSVQISLHKLVELKDPVLWGAYNLPDEEEKMREFCGAISECPETIRLEIEAKLSQSPLHTAAEYFEQVAAKYFPDLTMKRPSELAKVELLEEVVQKGTLEDLEAVLETYGPFEMTARALGLAARYRGLEYVKVLAAHGASFNYKYDSPALKKKYFMVQKTAVGEYRTKFYLMILPERLIRGALVYEYTAMYGVGYMKIWAGMKPLSLEKRIETAQYFKDNNQLGVSMDDMLFWALTGGEIAFADALMEMGVTLQNTPPDYYTSTIHVPYIDIITQAGTSVYRTCYIDGIASLRADQLLQVMKRFQALAAKAGRKLVVTQVMLDRINWNDEALAYVFRYADISRLNRGKTLEMISQGRNTGALQSLVEVGWLSDDEIKEKFPDWVPVKTAKDKAAQLASGDMISMAGIQWRLLAVNANTHTALVLADELIGQKVYHEKREPLPQPSDSFDAWLHIEYKPVDWETCTLRAWLNGEYLQENFTEAERSAIYKSHLTNPDNPTYGTSGGNDTEDKIFLLSLDEVKLYLAKKPDRTAKYHWWLRSPGQNDGNAAFIGPDGKVDRRGHEVDHYLLGVRPAFRLDMTSEFFRDVYGETADNVHEPAGEELSEALGIELFG